MNPRFRFYAKAICLLLTLIVAAQVASAQIAGGSIVSNVTDANGASLPAATVNAIDLNTNRTVTATTNEEGYYEFPLLSAGRYVVEVQASGFEARRSEEFTLNSGTRPKVDVKLGAAGVTEQVTVTESGTLVNATNTELGNVIEQRKIDALPLNGRNFIQLVGLQAGVINQPPGNVAGRGGFEFNGAPALGNNLLLDGVDMSFGENNSAAIRERVRAARARQLTPSASTRSKNLRRRAAPSPPSTDARPARF